MRFLKSSGFLLLLITFLGTLLRTIGIGHQLWMDELATSWVCSGDFSDVLERWDVTALSPLYYSIVYLGKLLFGFSEWGLRVPNVLFGILTIPLVYKFALALTKSRYASLIAAAIIAFDVDLIFYSQELRAYSILIFFALLHIYLLYLYLEVSHKRVFFLGFVLTGPILLWLHYTVIPLFLIDLILLVFKGHKDGRPKNYFTIISIFLGTLLLSSFPLFRHMLWLRANSAVLDSFISNLNLLQILTLNPQIVLYFLLPFLVGLSIECLLNSNSMLRLAIHIQPFLYMLLTILGPVVSFLFIDYILGINLFYRRYLIWTIPFIVVFSTMCVFTLRSLARFLSICVLLTMSLSSHIKVLSLSLSAEHSYQIEILKNIHGYSSDVGEWGNAVSLINDLSYDINQVYFYTSLVEKEFLSDRVPDQAHLRGYLLSSVNSLYPLQSELLESCIIVNSSTDLKLIQDRSVLIGPKKLVEAATSEIERSIEFLSDNDDHIIVAIVQYKEY